MFEFGASHKELDPNQAVRMSPFMVPQMPEA
jgi:hypothetical protein